MRDKVYSFDRKHYCQSVEDPDGELKGVVIKGMEYEENTVSVLVYPLKNVGDAKFMDYVGRLSYE